ncbi:phage major capsid protein [Lysinibacillus varians]|uniref:Phage major capsid protein n=1 Tax=Lysinibacillus varians TaxID=1145276 RepID=A0ABY2TAN4_9BACI|nr:phage major capsid protein [Lysinibacillus varians]AHN20302.1 primosomal replication protein N [Lysinibacillus varians]TKI63026.1 phage major capsid protein [Lysinibacillus varians]
MNKKLLKALQKRLKGRLTELRSQLEAGDIAEEAIEGVTAEIQELSDELKETEQALADLEDDPGNDDPENRSADNPDEEEEEEDKEKTDPEKRGGISQSAQTAVNAIGKALSTRNSKSTKKREAEIRSAFANFVVGNITESEARSLGIAINNGMVTVPVEISKEVISYAQEENLLRKYGTYIPTDADVKYPVLVKKADANVSKKERAAAGGKEVPKTDIEFDSIDLDPAEFDALATVTKKLLKRTGVKIEQIIIEELTKAYVRKEINYMFNGNDPDNENDGALAKKAVHYYETVTIDPVAVDDLKLYKQLVKLKGQPVTEVLKKSMWIVNRAALTLLEGMTDSTGKPLLHEATEGLSYKLLGHKLDFTDAADGEDPTKPVFYFGDFSKFYIQEIKGGMELQKLVEKYAGTNEIGFQIYNLIDGQLIYSPFEPAVYRYEVGATKPGS